MTKDEGRSLLSLIRELAKNDIVISTFLKFAEVDARIKMIGERIGMDKLDEMIVMFEMKDMISSILSFQAMRIESLNNDLKEVHESQNKSGLIVETE